jgi:NADH-quinone oxidoreductase subunit J
MATTLIFGALALVVVGTAIGMLLSRNAVYAALFLVLNFASVAVLYVLLGAPFIAMTQITVYTGAIMVLFVFVIMLLAGEKLPDTEQLFKQRVAFILVGLVLLAELALVVVVRGGSVQPMVVLTPDFAGPEAMGLALFQQYALPFEVTSAILLVAAVGAVLLTKDKAGKSLMRPNKED